MGYRDFENDKVPLLGPKTGKINTSMSAAHKTSSCASKTVITAM